MDQLLPDHELPDQELPDQLLPDHELPDQEFPDHELPDQLLPDHELPDQELPDHELPDQELPVQVLPFQVPPDQELPAAWSTASAFVSIGLPKMSFSPERTMPSRVMWSLPRASSSVPPPFAGPKLCVKAAGVLVAITARSILPAPWAWLSAPGTFLALSVMNRLTWSGVRFGYFWRMRATVPEVIAAACDVPEPRK